MTQQIPIEEAAVRFLELIEAVEQGDEILLRKGTTVIACLVPPRKPELRLPRLGTAAGHVWIAPDFDETPEDFDEYI